MFILLTFLFIYFTLIWYDFIAIFNFAWHHQSSNLDGTENKFSGNILRCHKVLAVAFLSLGNQINILCKKKIFNARIIWLILGQLDEVNVTMMRRVIIGSTLLLHWCSDRVSMNSYTDQVKFEGVLRSSPRLIKTYRLILAFLRLHQVNREREDFGYAEKGVYEKRFLIVKTI